MLCKVTHCTWRISANTRPHQLRWGDQEMGTAISCIKRSQVAGLIQRVGRSSLEASSLRAAVLRAAFFVWNRNCHVLSMCAYTCISTASQVKIAFIWPSIHIYVFPSGNNLKWWCKCIWNRIYIFTPHSTCRKVHGENMVTTSRSSWVPWSGSKAPDMI